MPDSAPQNFDLVVIGAGPGGYVAARRGAQLGLKTALVEKDDRLGGTCLLRGCIPTKALIHAAEIWRTCNGGARSFGIDVTGARFDWSRVQKRRALATTKGSKGVQQLMASSGVEVIHGRGRLAGPGRVKVEAACGERLLEAGRVVLATGSRIAVLKGMEPDGQRILDSDQLLELPEVPPSMVVLGAGAVGLELASVMQAFGCRVTLVEVQKQVLPLEDPEVAAEVQKALARQKVRVLTGTRARGVEKTPEGVRVTLQQGKDGAEGTVEAATLLVAVGRKPVTRDLGLETTDAVVNLKGFVQTDAMMETAEPGLYAVGDIVSTPQLAHLASHEALVAVHHAAGRPLPPIHYRRVPSCVYSHPEVASVGLQEEAARNAGHEVRVGRFPFAALGKASILNQPHGFVKIISDRDSGQVLGVHMVGPRVTELLAEATTALGFEATVERWSEVIHPHPTLSEAVAEAATSAHGLPLHGGL